MKLVTIYRRPDLSYTLNSEQGEPVQAHFLHTRSSGDYNKVTYSDKRLKGARNVTRAQFFAVRHTGYNDPSDAEIEREVIRGRTFFKPSEGILFGAYASICKLAEIAIIPVHA